MADYVIIGGHGKVALRAAPLLVEAGHTVTSVIRNPEHTEEVEATGATALVLDIENASVNDFAEALTGKDAVVWSAGAGGGNPDRTYAVDRDAARRSIDAAQQAGVQRYVMVSYAGAGLDHGIPEDNSFYPYAQSKAEADAHLRDSGLDYTILGPGLLTLEEPTGRVSIDNGSTEPAQDADGGRDTSRGNVAASILAALEEDATIGKTIDYYDGDTELREAFAAL
ncbi:MAG: SDR family oxidoreductase [Micrococcaceae bacterium]